MKNKKGTIILIVSIIIIIILGGSRMSLFDFFNKKQSAVSYKNITTAEVASLIDKGEKMVLLDVREPYEYKQSHIEGSMLIPLGSLSQNLDKLDKDDKIIVICRSGNRSVTASKILINNGFNNVSNMLGGMLGWEKR